MIDNVLVWLLLIVSSIDACNSTTGVYKLHAQARKTPMYFKKYLEFGVYIKVFILLPQYALWAAPPIRQEKRG
jgi:hypothetical protein